MAKTQTPDYSSFEKYETANVAARYAQQGDLERAQIALLATPIDDDGRVLLENDPHYSTDKGIKSASQLYGNKFSEGLLSLNFSDLKGFYEGQLSKLPEDIKGKAEELFDKYSNKKLADLQAEYVDAKEILDNPGKHKRKISKYVKKDELDDIFEKDIKKSQKIIQEYSGIIQVRNLLQETRESPIEQKIRENLLEKILRE